MTTIQLTQEQKDKLIEMCNKLFPDTEWHFWQSEDDDRHCEYPLTIGYSAYAVLGKDKDIHPAYECHWFEFVMTHLTDIIYTNAWKQMRKNNKLFNIVTKEGFYVQVLHHKCEIVKHPVDYLYNIFKELK